MEHVVQFGVNIDDEKIQQAVIGAATKQVEEKLSHELFNYYYRSSQIQGLSEYTQELVKKKLDDWKDEIIAGAIKVVAESIKNTKKYKEAVKSLEDIIGKE